MARDPLFGSIITSWPISLPKESEGIIPFLCEPGIKTSSPPVDLLISMV